MAVESKPLFHPDAVESFISRWENSGAAERANYQMFLSELCDILEVPRPDPTSPDPENNLYVFDRAITRGNPDGSSVTNYIDLYKARHFVCETKQGINDCSVGLRPSLTTSGREATESTSNPTISADLSPSNAIDGHRPPLQSKSGHGKRGSAAFDKALERAYHQGRDYITHLPASHGRPPFLIVCDVGHSIDLYAEFTCTGGRYERFPDPKNHRIQLTDLRRPEIRERLRLVFTDPHSLDPSKRAAEVTRDIATRLARLAKSLEADGHDPQVIAGFLQRCLFTMFAEDIGLLPEDGFKNLLKKVESSPQGFPVLVSGLWREMATGTQYSALLFQEIAHFNGGLFETTTALPLSAAQLDMLADAAASDWSEVEPSIFGTLLVRALDPRERHKLGAEFTPRSYVERLNRPTIIEPLRDEWDATRIAAANLHREAEAAEDSADEKETEAKQLLSNGNSAAAKETGAAAAKLRNDAKKKDAEALKLVTDFHRYLCSLKFLDPACGTANFLYVTLEHMKRLEAEVLELITALGGDATFEMNEYKVRPEQFLGLELSPNAVAIAQLVLWIGYFQWQRKTTGKADTGDRPLLPKTQSIRQQDAVLAYDERIPRRDPETGEILTIWNGHSTKPHPVTGKEVPDESARTVLFDYINPRRAEWPKADYIVGNPPFLGKGKMRDALGDGYTEALRKAWKGDVPESADFVMFWWCKAAAETAQGRCKRFGFITTNSIHQTFNRRVIEPFLSDAKKPLHLAYAIPDHPWIDSADGAAVRIAMTVGAPGQGEGTLGRVINETVVDHGENDVVIEHSIGNIASNLQIGADGTTCGPLQSNSQICSTGLILGGRGFVLTEAKAKDFGDSSPLARQIIHPFWSGKDITDYWRNNYLIDTHGLSESELSEGAPRIWQHLRDTVFPERQTNRDPKLKKLWWLFRRANTDIRGALLGLPRYIVTPETSKHRFFVMLNGSEKPEHRLVVFGHDDSYILGVLSTTLHGIWALAMGGTLEDRPVYNKSRCFDPFPFPALEEGPLKQRIRDLGERLDAHRKRQQELHPGLTLTGMYNVLEKLRAGEALTAKDKQIHDQGLVTLLKQLHDELDQAVLEAYGWGDLAANASHCSVGLRPSIANEEAPSLSPNGIDGHRPTLQDISSTLEGPPPQSIESELLTRLVTLNHARAAEEKSGLIRWLRPDYQCSGDHRSPQQTTLPGTEKSSTETPTNRNTETPAWPAKLPAQVTLIRQLLATDPAATPEQLAARFGRKNAKRTEQIEGIIETLRGLGQV